MKSSTRRALLATALALALAGALPTGAALAQVQAPSPAQAQPQQPQPRPPATAPDRVVYHIDAAATQALKGLRNIRNHLDVAPDTRIVVVTHAEGVDLLMEGAKDDRSGTEYAPLVSALRSRGVRFEVCEITLRNRSLKRDQFIAEAEFTPSGVARIGQLQAREGYAYIKP